MWGYIWDGVTSVGVIHGIGVIHELGGIHGMGLYMKWGHTRVVFSLATIFGVIWGLGLYKPPSGLWLEVYTRY